ncbi:MAG: T9SS type A sorting domain-containing protein, partial [Bacteroidota bacterium]
GESYGITNTFHAMFGIGTNTSVDYAVIHWPAGGMQVIENPGIDMYHEFIEGACTAPTAVISADGSPTLCSGQSVTLQLDNASSEFLWNTGSTQNSINVNSAGSYSVYVYNPGTTCAAQSNVILIEEIVPVTPTIEASNDLEICAGESLVLTASEGQAYLWSNGAQTQSIAITASGDYSVSVEGECGFLDSEAITVNVLAAPAPAVVDVEITSGETATLTTDGTTINWYDSEVSDTPVATGPSFTTPAITQTTSYWVEEVFTYGGEEGNGGKLTNESAPYGQFHNSSNFWNRFDALEDIFINSVKVYAGNAGSRTIQLVDAGGNMLQELIAEIPQGESFVTLDFFVPAGTGYGLRTTTSNPQLWRDRNLDSAAPFGFPYDIGGLASITGTTVTGVDADNYYYFFYDWTVSTPLTECVSPREEVQVIVVGIEENELVSSLTLYPNPVQDDLRLAFNSRVSGAIQLRLVDTAGRLVHTSNIVAMQGMNSITMNMSAFAPGMYQLQLLQGSRTVSTSIAVR